MVCSPQRFFPSFIPVDRFTNQLATKRAPGAERRVTIPPTFIWLDHQFHMRDAGRMNRPVLLFPQVAPSRLKLNSWRTKFSIREAAIHRRREQRLFHAHDLTLFHFHGDVLNGAREGKPRLPSAHRDGPLAIM